VSSDFDPSNAHSEQVGDLTRVEQFVVIADSRGDLGCASVEVVTARRRARPAR
jgi:hypothetical protein